MALLLKPTNVLATALSPYSIRLTWTNNDVYEAVQIWRSLDDYDYGSEPHKVIDGGLEIYVDSELDENTLYSYYLVGITYEPPNNSADSDASEATTFHEGDPPSELVATPYGAVTVAPWGVEVTWKINSTQEDYVIVERKPDGGAYAEIESLKPRTNYFRDPGFQILTLAAAGYVNCVPTDMRKFVNDDGIPIGILLWYNNGTRTWTVSSFYTIANGSAMTITNGTGAGDAEGDSLGLALGQKYWYRAKIRWLDNGGDSAYSNADDVTTYDVPTAPANLAITELQDKRLRLTWTLGTGTITGTKIEKSETGEFTGEQEPITFFPGHIDGTLTDFLVTGLDPSTRYWFRIRHYGPGGHSAWGGLSDGWTRGVYAPSEFEKWIRAANIEIVALLEVNPGKVLTGFTLVGGKTWTYELAITDRAIVDFEKVYEDGEEYPEKSSINEVEGAEADDVAFWFDTSAKILYVHTSTGANPSLFFIEGKFWLYLSNKEDITFNGNFYLPFLSLEDIPSVSQEIEHYSGGSFTISSGTIEVKNEEGGGEYFFDKRFTDYVWRDAKVILKIGKPGFTYTQYEAVFMSLIDTINCNDKLLSIELKDLRTNLDVSVPMNKYTEEEFMDTESAEEGVGKTKPKVFGTATVIAVCIDSVRQRWQFHDGRVKYVWKVWVDDVLKSPIFDYTADYKRGIITFDRDAEIDWEEDVIKVKFSGIVNSADEGIINGAEIFRHVLTDPNFMNLSKDDLDHDSIYATKVATSTALSAPLYKEEKLTEIIRKIENSMKAATFQDEEGRIGLQIAQAAAPSDIIYVENFHMAKESHEQKKGSDFLFKEINIYFQEDVPTKEWQVSTLTLPEFSWKYGKRKPLKPLDIHTYFRTGPGAKILGINIKTKLEQLEKGLVIGSLPWILFGCRAGDLIKLSRKRFYSSSGTADEITVRLLTLEKAIASKKTMFTGVIVS